MARLFTCRFTALRFRRRAARSAVLLGRHLVVVREATHNAEAAGVHFPVAGAAAACCRWVADQEAVRTVCQLALSPSHLKRSR